MGIPESQWHDMEPATGSYRKESGLNTSPLSIMAMHRADLQAAFNAI